MIRPRSAEPTAGDGGCFGSRTTTGTDGLASPRRVMMGDCIIVMRHIGPTSDSCRVGALSGSVKRIIEQAKVFAEAFASMPHPDLLGVTDGKAVGTYIELAFKKSLSDIGIIEATEGNAAKGIDLPSFNTDLKVTSLKQPQSSSPFASFKQKIEGLGYDLIVFVYVKNDTEGVCNVRFEAVRHVPARLTADFQTTKGLRRLIVDEGANVDDVFAFLVEKNIPADEASLYDYAEHLLKHPPEQGYLTISNALQWRLQYSRVVAGGIPGVLEIV